MNKLSFCQNNSPMRGSFWQKDILITCILFELCLFWYLAQSTYLWDTLYVNFIWLKYLINLPLIHFFFQFRNIQKVWKVLFGRAKNYARTSFGTRSRYIDSNRSHLRNNSYIRNLKRYVNFIWLKYLLNDYNYVLQSTFVIMNTFR